MCMLCIVSLHSGICYLADKMLSGDMKLMLLIWLLAMCLCREPIPDLGYYAPNRVNDNYIGLSSTEQAEDILLICEKKTEVRLTILILDAMLCQSSSCYIFNPNYWLAYFSC